MNSYFPPSWRNTLLEDDVRITIALRAFDMYLDSHDTGTPIYICTMEQVPKSLSIYADDYKEIFVTAYNYYSKKYPDVDQAFNIYNTILERMNEMIG